MRKNMIAQLKNFEKTTKKIAKYLDIQLQNSSKILSLDIVLDCKITVWICAFLLFSLFLETLKKLRKRLKRNFFPTYQLCPTCLIVDFSSLTDVSDSHNRFLLYLMLWHQDKGVQLKSSITQKHFAEKVGQVDTSSTLIFGILLRSEEGNFPIVATQ